MKIALVGATGLVGSVMLKVLEERGFSQDELILSASEKSVGKSVLFAQKQHIVVSVQDAVNQSPDIAIFSAGSSVSLKWAPKFAEKGCYVVDNSSAWRMYPEVPLVVPEINADTISQNTKIIANPNCSTIQMVMVLAPLHRKYQINRIVVSTYQSVSGTGVKAVQQLFGEREGRVVEKAYPYPIDLNVLPHGGTFEENGYTTEETKLVNETRKILRTDDIAVSATVARVPVIGGHSESVNIEFEKDYDIEAVNMLLNETSGVVVQDNPAINLYPMPLYSKDKDAVFVGRIRRDFSRKNTLNLWIVADNLRKGAATNAIQIADYLRREIIKN